MPNSPLDVHTATPQELSERLAAERKATAFLVYRDAAGQQAILSLHDADRVTIGRGPANQLTVDWDAEVSRTHAVLERIGGDWIVVDDGLSHNGTHVNGHRVIRAGAFATATRSRSARRRSRSAPRPARTRRRRAR